MSQASTARPLPGLYSFTRLQRFRHLRNLLKPIPLDTPTVLELEPGNHLQVTLIDANHCPGAVMFCKPLPQTACAVFAHARQVLEGQGRAVLYTGDIRSEPWWVNSISRSPSLLEYAMGLKTLDTIYLDTSFVEPIPFPTKAEGIAELLEKVKRYPPDTIFHFQAWTYGYEDVWLALSKALRSKIHVDEYKWLIFRSLAPTSPEDSASPSHLVSEAPGLVGFMCGNAYHAGCLTRDENVRLHSCEKGVYCDTVKNNPVVWIRPIITRLSDGRDVVEAGVGGGGEDLRRKPELGHLSLGDADMLIRELSNMGGVTPDVLRQAAQFLLPTVAAGRKVPLDLSLSGVGHGTATDLKAGLQAIARRFQPKSHDVTSAADGPDLPNTINFPYSRHSSYPELCHLLSVFKPRDVWPCTVDTPRWLREGITMERLFGEHCSGDQFRHDCIMRAWLRDLDNNATSHSESQATVSTYRETAHASQVQQIDLPNRGSQLALPVDNPLGAASDLPPIGETEDTSVCGPRDKRKASPILCSDVAEPELGDIELDPAGSEGPPLSCPEAGDPDEFTDTEVDPEGLMGSQASAISALAVETRAHAFRVMLQAARGKTSREIGLMSTTDHHSTLEKELLEEN
ncbi:hypothetical protein VTJ83DRAFT_5538 [Remersonia thermophila]|uniref:DNA repair metallo-beta-lactamase domain-containing protein n=1 Tax=Remersonia thermophila TaxID=72144 RepID=A0ABR4D752_9PEZI